MELASDDTMTSQASLEFDGTGDGNDGFDYSSHPHSLSRLSVCTSSSIMRDDDDEEEDDHHHHNGNYFQEYEDGDNTNVGLGCVGGSTMRMFMSRLSIESFDGDADEELSSDDCYSLPATPPRRNIDRLMGIKGYASDTEDQKGFNRTGGRRRRIKRATWIERAWGRSKTTMEEEEDDGIGIGIGIGMESRGGNMGNNNNSGGESEGGGGVVVIARPKGGRRPLCMDLEEVKACRDLGFELEHERISVSVSTLDTTSSGDNSPIASLRISSPGDDPRDVKARLKVWAQAVALASTSGHGT